jgi:transcriptional regulator with XRE-family HTH domain
MTEPFAGTRKRQTGNTDAVLGRVLRAVREKKHLSQDELGHRAGYSRNYIGLLEQGKASPSVRALFNIAIALGVRPSLLIRRAETSERLPKASARKEIQ